MPTSGKTIAKNTVFLYFRMTLVMLVSLYTSRIVLDVLGASDYGLYNVVGGIVAMLAFLNGSISAGTSRFISYELGKGDSEQLRNVFNVALVSHISIALIVFVIAETIGLWFLNTQIVFDESRTTAVNVVYQLSILTTMLNFTQIPYTATIVAHEKMSIYAYISILEVVLKLLMVLLLTKINNFDALIAYSIMVFGIQFIILSIYRFYCHRKYEESHWRFVKDNKQYKTILSFAGWDVIGSLCVITQGQGINILLNMYFGPVVNAARAVAYQVQGAFHQFTGNFMMAVNPQIVKSFACKEYKAMVRLINNASLYSYYLLLIFVMPVMFRLQFILNLWLKEVPEYTEVYTLIILTNMMIRAIANPVIKGVHATGDIKMFNLIAGGIGLLPLLVCWMGFYFGMNSIFAFWIVLLWGVIANIVEILFLKKQLPEFSITEHLRVVYLRSFLVTIAVLVPCWFINSLFNNTFWGVIEYYIVALIVTASIVFFTGLTKSLKTFLINKIKDAIHRFI